MNTSQMQVNNMICPRARRYILALIFLSFVSLELACADHEKLNYYLGDRYLKGKYPPYCRCINLPMIYAECSLQFIEGDTIPPQISERVVLIRGDEMRRVNGPNDLKGCANIETPDEAIEYLRFFSSENTAHLFEDVKKEIFAPKGHRGCILVCMTNKNWNDLHLHDPVVTPKNDGFEITRFIIKPFPKAHMPTLYKEIVLVHKDGAVDLISEEKITDDPKYTEGVGFGGFI